MTAGASTTRCRRGPTRTAPPKGPRVPLIIVSPYARPGYTDTTATTFAGILAYTEHTFGLSPLGANDAAAYPFSDAFNYTQAPLQAGAHGAPAAARIGQAHPPDPRAGKRPDVAAIAVSS